jgi:hypothetical protein
MSFNFFRAGSTLLMTRIRAMCVAAMIGGSAAVSAQTPTVPCDEVFIQDYEYDDGGAVYRAFTPCPGDDLQGAPAYPVQQKRVHKEYVRGDYYAVQVSYEWHWEPANRADCVHITRRVTRSYVLVERGVEHSARVDHEGVKRSRDTGENYRGSFVAGGGAKARVPRNAPQARAENTRFGIQCLRLGPVSPLAALGDACLPILEAPQCKAELHLMPIEVISAPGDGIRLAGRTTRLELLPNDTVLDRTGWVMP